MRYWRWLRHEIRALLTAMLFFATCFAAIEVLKTLMVARYGITAGTSVSVLMLSLVTAKVVVLFERVSFGKWIGLVEVLIRSAAYAVAAFVLLLLEHALSERRDAGGFVAALVDAYRHPDMPLILATLLCVTLVFVVWNAFAVLGRALGRDRISAAFLKPSAATGEAGTRH